MQDTQEITVQSIRPESLLYQEVKQLWRTNSKTLGFLPDGAFLDHASQGHLLVAVNGSELMGYTLYRTGKRTAGIIHMCVAPNARGNGVARTLLNGLRAQVNRLEHITRIELRCRRDYGIDDFWAALGFVARVEKVGRGKDAAEVTEWHMKLERASLFDGIDEEETKLRVSIDTNVFLDLEVGKDPEAIESRGLVSDWIIPYLQIEVTPELQNDLNRQQDNEERQRVKRKTKKYVELAPPQLRVDECIEELREHFSQQLSDNDESDLRHIAQCVASGISVFVTRDDALLKKSSKLRELHGLEILRPSELIGRIDTLSRSAEYQQRFVAGANSLVRERLKRSDSELRANFCNFHGGELKRKFNQGIQECLAHPHSFEVHVVKERRGDDVALEAIDWRNEKYVNLKMFRVRASRFAGSLACTLLSNLTLRAATENKLALIATDAHTSETVTTALHAMGFIPADGSHVKFTPRGIFKAEELGAWVENAANELSVNGESVERLISVLRSDEIHLDPSLACQVEHLLWPAKLIDCQIETYLVSIQPEWASHLFEETLANETLFGAEEHLAINPEAVYYRAARPKVSPHGRILWYVSSRGKYLGRMSLRACSRIRDVNVEAANILFKRYRRLGIFEWENVLKVAKGVPDASIMAVNFDDTELLPNPIKWNDLEHLLETHGVFGTIQGPRKLPNEAFIEIYERCIGAGLR